MKKIDKFCGILTRLEAAITEFNFIIEFSKEEAEKKLSQLYQDECYDTSVEINIDDFSGIVHQYKKSPEDLPDDTNDEFYPELPNDAVLPNEHSWCLPKNVVEDVLIPIFKRRLKEFHQELVKSIDELSKLKIKCQSVVDALSLLTIMNKESNYLVLRLTCEPCDIEEFKKEVDDYIRYHCDGISLSKRFNELKERIVIELEMQKKRGRGRPKDSKKEAIVKKVVTVHRNNG